VTQTKLYAAVLAKIGAEKSKLVSDTKLKAMAEAKSLTEFTAQLRDTSYQPQILKVPAPLTSRKLERAFKENLIETYAKMIKNTPKSGANFLSVYMMKFEIENIKSLIKGISAEQNTEQKSVRIYFSAEDYLKKRPLLEEAAKASTFRQIVNVFKNTVYGSAIAKGAQSYEEDGSTAAVDVLLDKVFYDIIYEHYIKLPKRERTHAFFYAGLECDSFTLMAILRSKILNYDVSWLRTAVPRNKFSLSYDVVESMLVAPDFESALKTVFETPYGKYFTKGLSPEDTLASAEKAFNKAKYQRAKVDTVAEIFNVGAPLAFMMIKESEVHNLVASSAGVEASMPADRIESHMLF
jgi:V/A-type H+-transporting ATPase subunit C